MSIRFIHTAVAAILAASLASGPAVAGQYKLANGAAKGNNGAAIGKNSSAATPAIPQPKLPYKPDAIDSSIRENGRDLDEIRGLGRLGDALRNGDIDGSMGALGKLPSADDNPGAPNVGRRSDWGPSVAKRESARQGDGSFNGRDWGPKAPASRPGEIAGPPGSPNDAVPDGPNKASDGYESIITTTGENPDGSKRITVSNEQWGHADDSQNRTETSTSTVHADGSEDIVTVTTDSDGTVRDETHSHYRADGSGAEVTHFSNGSHLVRTWDQKGQTTRRQLVPPPQDGQPAPEGNTPGGNDPCGWNPLYGCTKAQTTRTSIWSKLTQPGPGDENGGSSAGSVAPNVGPEAVTNPDEQHLSGYGGGNGRPYDPRDNFGGEGGGPGPSK